jgi:hypothetical protein
MPEPISKIELRSTSLCPLITWGSSARARSAFRPSLAFTDKNNFAPPIDADQFHDKSRSDIPACLHLGIGLQPVRHFAADGAQPASGDSVLHAVQRPGRARVRQQRRAALFIETNTRKGEYSHNINQPLPGPGTFISKPRMFSQYPATSYLTNGAGHLYNGSPPRSSAGRRPV